MACANEVKLSGKFVIAYVEGVKHLSDTYEEQALDILETNGIDDPRPDESYCVPAFAKSLEDTADAVGPMTIRRVGASVVQASEWDPEIDSVDGAFEAANDVLDRVHENGDESDYGRYRFEKLGETRRRVAATTEYPYPAPFARGIFEGMIEMFTSERVITNTMQVVTQDDEKFAYQLSW